MAPVRERGGLQAMPLEPAFLFSNELLQNALPELLSQTGTTGRQFAQLLIRVWQETRHNNFPDIERAAEECGGREMPLTLDALLAIGKRHGLHVKWFDDCAGRRRRTQTQRSVGAIAIRGAGLGLDQQAAAQSGRAPQVRTRILIGHKLLHNGDGVISPHSARHSGEVNNASSTAGMGAQDVLYAWRDFECSFFAGGAVVSANPVRRFLIRESHSVLAGRKPRRYPRPYHAPHDGRIAVPALAFFRRVRTRLSTGRLSWQRHSTAVGT